MALLFVIAVAIVAAGLWLFLSGLFLEDETNVWYVIICGWLIGLGGDRHRATSQALLELRRRLNDASELARSLTCFRDEDRRIAVKIAKFPNRCGAQAGER